MNYKLKQVLWLIGMPGIMLSLVYLRMIPLEMAIIISLWTGLVAIVHASGKYKSLDECFEKIF